MLTLEGGAGGCREQGCSPSRAGPGAAGRMGAHPRGRAGGFRGQECSPWRAGPGAAESRGAHPRGQGRGLQGGCELTLEGGAGGCRGQE